jgi:peptidyl-prolyl cis-trans isomerase A (cyclophilin A)
MQIMRGMHVLPHLHGLGWVHAQYGARAGLLLLVTAALGCRSEAAPEPTKDAKKETRPAAAAPATPVPTPAPVAPAAQALTQPGPNADPKAGKFTLEDAMVDLPGTGSKLSADLETSEGVLRCELWGDKAPNTVANFVGLARGKRPWLKGAQWVTEPLYDGTPFHRVIAGFMIQGGDPLGNGQGGPGYVIADEVWPGAHHDQRGLLCMANRGANTNGSQFFITDGAPSHLDGGYTIFGKCGPDPVIQKISASPKAPGGDRPATPPVLRKVTIRRG